MSLPPRHSRDLAEYGSVFRRRRTIALTCLFIGIMGGIGLLWTAPTAYLGVAEVQVSPTGLAEPQNPVTTRQREALNLDTEAQIAQSSVVATNASRVIGGDPEELRALVSVDVPPNSGILRISFTWDDATGAAAGAQAFADAYLAHRLAAAEGVLTDQKQAILAKLRLVNSQLSTALVTMSRHARGTPQRALAAHQQSVLARQATALSLRYDVLKTTAVTPGTVITPATPPTSANQPQAGVYVGGGLFAGILLGTGAAFARDRYDTRLRTPADVERLTNLALLPQGEEFAAVVTAAGHRSVLVEGLGVEPAHVAWTLEEGFPPASGILLVTAGPTDSAVLAVALGRVRAPWVLRAARSLKRRGIDVLGVIAVDQAGAPGTLAVDALRSQQPPTVDIPQQRRDLL
ncbi:YveK family protein [Herbidospora sp. RD11066]